MKDSVTLYDSANAPSAYREELYGIFNFRELVEALVYRDLVSRYKRSVLGVVWTFLHPLGLMLVMYVVFSSLFNSVAGFHVYLLSGLVAWMFFSTATSEMATRLLWGGDLLKRIYLPKSTLLIAAVVTNFINMCLMSVPLLVVAILSGYVPNSTLILLPVAFLLLATFAAGLGMVIATFTTFFADGAQIYAVVLRGWFYLSPIFWRPDMIHSERVQRILALNPMADYLTIFRAAIYDRTWPDWHVYGRGGVVAVSALIVGWLVLASNSQKLTYRI